MLLYVSVSSAPSAPIAWSWRCCLCSLNADGEYIPSRREIASSSFLTSLATRGPGPSSSSSATATVQMSAPWYRHLRMNFVRSCTAVSFHRSFGFRLVRLYTTMLYCQTCLPKKVSSASRALLTDSVYRPAGITTAITWIPSGAIVANSASASLTSCWPLWVSNSPGESMTFRSRPSSGTSRDAALHFCVTELEALEALNASLLSSRFPIKLLPSPVVPTSSTFFLCRAMVNSDTASLVTEKNT
mmetsp:Transcript_9356/g.23605  ORF Transcript_9356/g.23605 Transcript_9356/m.23605 type:complete len:244 (-) Transcript_9356:2-733(-)